MVFGRYSFPSLRFMLQQQIWLASIGCLPLPFRPGSLTTCVHLHSSLLLKLAGTQPTLSKQWVGLCVAFGIPSITNLSTAASETGPPHLVQVSFCSNSLYS